MCVICIKKRGQELPPRDTFEAMMLANPDGFGYATDKEVFHSMDWLTFEEHFYNNVKPEDPCIIHFRLATHGSKKESNCHPFVDNKTGIAFAHNGILWDVNPKGDKTDSETAFRRFYVPAIKKFGYHSEQLDNTVKNTIGSSKFAFIDKKGVIRLFGQFVKKDGLFFSNLNFDRYLRRFYFGL